MPYADEELLEKREEAKKKKYQTLEDGIYLDGRVLSFERTGILDSFSVCLPDVMKIMPLDYARIKYPSEFRPQMILTTEDLSVSFLLDLAEHTRSFQGSGFRYSDMIRICMEAAGGLFIMPDRNKMAPGPLFLQYRETDWAFIKRVASHAGVAVIPEDATPGKKLYLGWRAHSVKEAPVPDSCRMEQDYEGYRKRTASGMKQLRASDFTGYHIRTREIYDLGENIRFEGQELVIGKATSWLEGQELYHEYHLIHKNAGLLPVLYNQKAAVVSLTGTVQAVRTTEVKVKLQEDENQEKCRSCWFDYATVYSTPDGTGW